MQITKFELIETILDQVNSNCVKKEKVDFWEEISLTDQSEIRNGIEELDKGKRVLYESFLKKIS